MATAALNQTTNGTIAQVIGAQRAMLRGQRSPEELLAWLNDQANP